MSFIKHNINNPVLLMMLIAIYLEKLVPAKVILFGEYAVLKGTKAIAFAINRFGTAKKSTGVTVIDPTKKVDLSAEFPTNNGLEISLDISLGSGLGSSAVVSVLLADIAIDKEFPEANKIVDISNNLSDEKLNKALQIENVFNGVSSGLDVTTSYVTGLIVYQNYSYMRLDAQHINKYKIMIFDSKITKNTKNASSKAVMTEEMIIEIDKITKEAERLLSSAFDISELYKLIRRNQDVLDKMKIVPESMSKEIQKQRMRGIESKITGAGFGGHLVTVVEKDVQIEGWEDVSIYEQ